MTPQERNQIVSENFADLLITYSGDPLLLEGFQDATINIVNFFHAVVHVPVEQITDNIILEMTYAAIPLLFGLISESSLEASGIRRLRNIPVFNLRGQGVLVGIVDTGIDYTNPVFRYADNTTRIAYLWDQTIINEQGPADRLYGTEYTRDQINQALASENPYSVVPSVDEIGHGTMIAGVAAGNDVLDVGFSGVVPAAELVVVKLKQAKSYLRNFFRVPEGVPCYQENDIIFGLQYLIEKANELNRPMAICIALGTSQGGHDGRCTLSNYISLTGEYRGISITVAAGNEGNARRHYYGVVDPLIGFDTVELNIGENETGFTMELWGDAPSMFSIDILTPSGEYVPRIVARLDDNREISFVFERTVIWIDYQMIEPQSGDQLILIRFQNPEPGIWRFNVYGRGDLQLGFHVWLPMQGFISENTFFVRSNPYTTILAVGNAMVPITTTAYNHFDNSLYINASRGFTRLGRVKPDIAAPGVSVLSPGLNHSFVEATGTSVAAAHLTGVTAILLEWGIIRGNLPTMSTLDIKNFLIRGARRDLDVVYPNRDWGYGILDVFEVFNRLRFEANM